MNKTQNDLCASKATLDYQALLDTSRIATHHCIEEIGRHIDNLRHNRYTPYLSAQWLLKEAEQLVITTETMHTLEEGLNRSRIRIINRRQT